MRRRRPSRNRKGGRLRSRGRRRSTGRGRRRGNKSEYIYNWKSFWNADIWKLYFVFIIQLSILTLYNKIVHALWLAERSVCIRVCKHGCDVNMRCFSRANHTSTNLKKVVEFKTRQVYFIYPLLPRLKLGKHLFAKQELITLARLRVQDLQVVRISLFISAITKSFALFSLKLF